MVVIDDQINYKSNSTITCTNYKWAYKSYWPLDDNGLGHNKIGTNLIIKSNQIPNATLTKFNSYGPKNGIVILSCFERNNKLNVSTYPIVNVMLNPLRIYISKRYMGNYKSYIYYQKNDLNTTTGNPNTATPNWFYYWRKFVDMKNCFDNYYNAGNSWGKTILNADFSGYTVFSDKASEVNDIPGILDQGIHVFHEVVVHESEHYDIYRKLWTKFGSGSYDPNKDLDGDFFPDAFELTVDGVKANFSVKNYSPDLQDKFGIKNSNGTIFEESICKLQEINLSNNRLQLEKFDMDDWSFDRSGQIQGKNWK